MHRLKSFLNKDKKKLTSLKIVTKCSAHNIEFLLYMELVMVVTFAVLALFVLPYFYVATQNVEAR